jgi:hypothetical protein
MSDSNILLKKPSYPVNKLLFDYLERFDRISKVSVCYDDLLRFLVLLMFMINNQDTVGSCFLMNLKEMKLI